MLKSTEKTVWYYIRRDLELRGSCHRVMTNRKQQEVGTWPCLYYVRHPAVVYSFSVEFSGFALAIQRS